MRAVLNGTVFAESDQTMVVEGGHYFPPSSVRWETSRNVMRRRRGRGKGRASSYAGVAGERTNRDAAWHYPRPSAGAERIAGRVACWHGVGVERPVGLLAGGGERVGLLRRVFHTKAREGRL